MTADALDQKFATARLGDVFAKGKSRLASVLTFFAYAGVFVGYMAIFLVSLLTVGFLEIRQANMSDFNALIAVLEQRDRYADNHLDKTADEVRKDLDAYRSRIASPVCFDVAGPTASTPNGGASQSAGPDGAGADPKTCSALKQALELHANQLSSTEDEVLFRSANLPLYYDQYQDGITRKTPQIIPALWFLDSKYRLLTLWARSPFELIEMFLLVCMGLLGGVISVMRYFVDPSLKNPAIGEFFYKPAAGAMCCFAQPRCSWECRPRRAPRPCRLAYFCWPAWASPRATAPARRSRRSSRWRAAYCEPRRKMGLIARRFARLSSVQMHPEGL